MGMIFSEKKNKEVEKKTAKFKKTIRLLFVGSRLTIKRETINSRIKSESIKNCPQVIASESFMYLYKNQRGTSEAI